MRPRCRSCRWLMQEHDMGSQGGNIVRLPECVFQKGLREIIRQEAGWWNTISRLWATTTEVTDPCQEICEDDYLSDIEDSAEAAIQSWLDGGLVTLNDEQKPRYRRYEDIADDVMWKFSRCRYYTKKEFDEAEIILIEASFTNEECEQLFVNQHIEEICAAYDHAAAIAEYPLDWAGG